MNSIRIDPFDSGRAYAQDRLCEAKSKYEPPARTENFNGLLIQQVELSRELTCIAPHSGLDRLPNGVRKIVRQQRLYTRQRGFDFPDELNHSLPGVRHAGIARELLPMPDTYVAQLVMGACRVQRHG